MLNRLGVEVSRNYKPVFPIGRQVQSGPKKMYAYTSIEPNEEPVKSPGRDGMPEASLKISNFEIFRSPEIKVENLISLHLLKKIILVKWGIH